MSSVLDHYSPETPITEDNRKASSWFQRWLSRLQSALDPSWQEWTPACMAGPVTTIRGAYYRDLGSTVDFQLNVDVTVTSTIQQIEFTQPVSVPAYGIFSGVYSSNLSVYFSLATFADANTSRIAVQRYDGSNFPAASLSFALWGNYRKL